MIEILAVCTIVAVLAALLFPALVRAKVQGQEASDISQMRQVALAGALYNTEYGQFPYRTEQLVSLGMLPKEECKLSLDRYREGFATHVMRSIWKDNSFYEKTIPPYPQSFLSRGMFGYGERQMQLFTRNQNPGWAFCANEGTAGPTDSDLALIWGTHYQRIQDDGAVTIHPVPFEYSINKGDQQVSLNFTKFYYDPSK
jgi:type II secretory pathway pseudopilin PulG